MIRGKVISLEIDESQMGDRGSKLDHNWFVKEQRVDGSSANYSCKVYSSRQEIWFLNLKDKQ